MYYFFYTTERERGVAKCAMVRYLGERGGPKQRKFLLLINL